MDVISTLSVDPTSKEFIILAFAFVLLTIGFTDGIQTIQVPEGGLLASLKYWFIDNPDKLGILWEGVFSVIAALLFAGSIIGVSWNKGNIFRFGGIGVAIMLLVFGIFLASTLVSLLVPVLIGFTIATSLVVMVIVKP